MRTKLGVHLLLVLVVAGAGAAASSASWRPSAPRTVSRGTEKASPVPPEVTLTRLADSLGSITAIAHAGDERLFLTLQRGRIMVWDGTQVLSTPFLDLSSLIVCCGEQGLLSTAFHPDYAENGYFYVDYTNLQGDTVIARYQVSTNPNVANPTSGVTLLTVDQPFANHNGGQLQFGPDGLLYIGMGDGGGANDTQCFAQRMEPQPGRKELLGKLLRIDVNQSFDTAPYYGIPADNPFVASGGPDEAWAKGLRNPWRFSFDRMTGDLFIGDVGQGSIEEIDFQNRVSTGGQNYGWKMMEGSECTGNDGDCPAGTPTCGSTELTLPIIEYSHESGRCSVTGGYLYRGLHIPALYARYIYGDYCSGEIWAGLRQGNSWSTELLPIVAEGLNTFGQDIDGELYVGTGVGTLYRIDRVSTPVPVIDAIAPPRGYERGSDGITITGTGFANGATVLFGSTASPSVTVVSPTQILVRTPPHAAGIVDVTVRNDGTHLDVAPAAFTYVAIPLVPTRSNETRVITRTSN